MRTLAQFLALLSGLGIQCCHKLWHRSQMLLRSGIAVAVFRPALRRARVWSVFCLGNVVFLGLSLGLVLSDP